MPHKKYPTHTPFTLAGGVVSDENRAASGLMRGHISQLSTAPGEACYVPRLPPYAYSYDATT